MRIFTLIFGVLFMPNMIDYLAWRGDLTFSENGFNEVDNLIFSELAYVDMDGIAPSDKDSLITVADIYPAYKKARHDQSYLVNDPYSALKKSAGTKRFGGIKLGGYVNRVDIKEQLQFSALTFLLDDGTAYVAFRGTDNTIVGWHEDFNMNYLPETPGQSAAADYLDAVLSATNRPVRVGGHSKGGNFAVYAAAFCKNPDKNERILGVYSNDGPGFNGLISGSEEYRGILPKITKIVPDASLVGMLLSSMEELTVVKSNEKGVQQHNPYTWEILGTKFERAPRSSGGIVDETIKKWSGSLDANQWQRFSDALFGALESSGASTFYELKSNKWTYYTAVARALAKTDRDVYKGFVEAVKILALSSRDVIWDETRKAFERKG